MGLRICSREFFSNYIFHTRAKELSKGDKNKALFVSIILGIFTLGVSHAVCAIKYHNRKFTLLSKESTAANKADQVYNKQKENKAWTFEELLNTNELNAYEIYEYASMFGAAPDLKFQLMVKAAKMDHPKACYEVGGAYLYGDTEQLQKDLQKAVTWFKRGAELKDASSCQSLMNIYLIGEGVEKDFNEAEKWGLECLKCGKKPSIQEGKFSHVIVPDSKALKEYFAKLKVNNGM